MENEDLLLHQLLSQRAAGVEPSFIREILKVAQQPGIISFAGGLPNESLFPLEAIRQASETVLAQEGHAALQYSSTEGHAGLREWITERYRKRFGLDIPVESILITNGSQQALDLLGKMLLNPGDEVGLEQPGYLGAIQAFSFYQPRFLSLPLKDDGIDLAAMEQVLARHRPKLLYTVPNFQNPSGISYSEENRKTISDLLRGKPTLLIEDDPYGELQYRGKAASSFKQLLPEQTLLLGSFSKTVLPSFRLGWIVAPPWLMKKLVIAKQSADLHSSGFTQRVLFRYLRDNDYNSHLNRLIEQYGSKMKAMLGAIEQYFPTEVTYTRPEGGMFIWATLPKNLSAMTLFQKSLQEKVAFVPGAPFYINRSDSNTLRLNYTNATEETIKQGIERLGMVLAQTTSGKDGLENNSM